MNLLQRSYSGQNFRPKPLVEHLNTHINGSAAETTLLITSWNESAHAEKVAGICKEMLSMSGDISSKEFGPTSDNLGPVGHRLRLAALSANKALYTGENASLYSAAVEFAAITIYKNSVFWAQVGCPNICIANGSNFQPLCYSPDWSWQIQQQSPLVCNALGLDSAVQLNCGSYRLQGDEKIVLLSRSQIPSSFYAVKKLDIETLSQALIDNDAETPFWIGILG